MTIAVKDIIEATGGRKIFGDAESFAGVSIDSRTIAEGELFAAIKGERFDGHDFVGKALGKGSGAMVSIPPAEPLKGKTFIVVGNTLRAIQDIARHLRQARAIPVIGVTGTNGKTTTKEMIASVLGMRFKVLKSAGNLNNQIGLPLSLMKLNSSYEAAVLEMGASQPGDIRDLCAIALPDVGVITNIGYAHLEGFGDIASLRGTKLEMLSFARTAVVNADDEFLMEGVKGYEGKVIKYAVRNAENADVYASGVVENAGCTRFVLHAGSGSADVELPLSGVFNVYNALAAGAVGLHYGLSLEEIARGLGAVRGVPMRFEVKRMDGVTVLSDVYNANPSSMEEAVKELVRLSGKRAVAVLGDMLELGPYAETAHRKLGAWMSTLPVGLFIAVGPLMAIAAEEFKGAKIIVGSAEDARLALLGEQREGDSILIKGSRGMKMEEVLADAI